MKHVPLTSAELGLLWTTYVNCTLTTCVLKYLLATAEDEEVFPLVQQALNISNHMIRQVEDIYTREKHPFPIGFTDGDVDTHAPRVFTDTFTLLYIKNMARVGLAAYGIALALSTRSDTCALYSQCIGDMIEMNNQALDLLLSKGMYIRPPSTFVPEQVSFVTKQSFLGGIIGHKRPLTAIEIAHLFANIQTNLLGKALLMGLGQGAKSKPVRDFVTRGANIAKEHIQILSSYIENESLPVPMHWDTGVLRATVSPFSDKLILFHALLINNVGLSDFGAAMGATLRADLAQMYVRLALETAEYGEDGMNLMIANQWFEKPPSSEFPTQP